MIVRLVIITWLCCFGLPAFLRAAQPDDPSIQAAASDDIREAVFRHQMQHNASGVQSSAAAYYLQVLDPKTGKSVDPSPSLMKRFAGDSPRVAPASECSFVAAEGVVDKKTGKPGGLVFIVGKMNWISNDEVKVEGGYYEGNLSASGNTYLVKKKDGKWVVTNDQMHWIS